MNVGGWSLPNTIYFALPHRLHWEVQNEHEWMSTYKWHCHANTYVWHNQDVEYGTQTRSHEFESLLDLPIGSIFWVWDVGGVGFMGSGVYHTHQSRSTGWLVCMLCYPLLTLPRPPTSQIILPVGLPPSWALRLYHYPNSAAMDTLIDQDGLPPVL